MVNIYTILAFCKHEMCIKLDWLGIKTKLSKKGKLDTPEQKAAFVASYDWDRMTAQDESVWKEIFDCLDK